MRVLLTSNEEFKNEEVLEVTNMYYDDDIFCVTDENGDYDRFSTEKVFGLCMVDTDGDVLYIKDIYNYQCTKICEEALVKGYVDLRRYGEYDYLDDLKL